MADEEQGREQARRASLVAKALFACLLVVVFGAGVWVGKPEQRRHSGEEKAKPLAAPEQTKALAECQNELAARQKAQAMAKAAALRAEEMKRSAPEMAAEIDVLEKKLDDCQKRDLLVRADLCGAGNKYSIIMTALLHGSQLCVDTAGIAEFIVKNYDQCPQLDDLPHDWTPDDYDLTEEERKRVVNAAHDHRRFNKEALEGLGEHVIRGCVEKYGRAHE